MQFAEFVMISAFFILACVLGQIKIPDKVISALLLFEVILLVLVALPEK